MAVAIRTSGFPEQAGVERLFPAIEKVSGMNPAEGPQPTVSEFPVHNYVKP